MANKGRKSGDVKSSVNPAAMAAAQPVAAPAAVVAAATPEPKSAAKPGVVAKAPEPAISNVAPATAKPGEAKPGETKQTPAPAAATPEPVAKPVGIDVKSPVAKPGPVVAKRDPVAAKPAPVVARPAPAAPVAPPPAALAPVPSTPLPTPAPALAAASLQKDTIMEATFNTPTDKTQALFADANDRAKTAMEKGSKLIGEMNDFSKGNIEAFVESSKIAAKGAEDVAKYTTDYAKASVEKANAAARQLASVKSPTEMFKLQSEFAKDAMDALMAETSKFTENYLKLLGEIAQPISNRVALAAEKMKLAA